MGTGATARIEVDQPLGRLTLFRQVGPLVGVALMGLLYFARPKAGAAELGLIVQAAALTAITVIATVSLPWDRLPAAFRAIPPMSMLVVAFLTSQATGGASSSYATLVLLPVAWVALYGTTGELFTALIGVAAALAAPLSLPGTAPGQWSRTVFLIGTSALVGVSVQFLFGRIRDHAAALDLLARTDHLTGVRNRRAWDEDLERAVRVAQRSGRPLCVAVLDLDRFKDFNDSQGHPAGDDLLRDVAGKWIGQLREDDLLARLGGDEFGTLLTSCTQSAAHAIVERLCADLPGGVRCSAGIAQWDGSESPFDLVARADRALYRAKESGRDLVILAELAAGP